MESDTGSKACFSPGGTVAAKDSIATFGDILQVRKYVCHRLSAVPARVSVTILRQICVERQAISARSPFSCNLLGLWVVQRCPAATARTDIRSAERHSAQPQGNYVATCLGTLQLLPRFCAEILMGCICSFVLK